jgi:hypothetical protein
LEPLWYDLLLSAYDNVRIESLCASLVQLNEATLLLQADNLSLADARFVLDEVIKKHDTVEQQVFSNRVSNTANIVVNKEFESGCVKLLMEDSAALSYRN